MLHRCEDGIFKSVILVLFLVFAVFSLCGPTFAFDEGSGDDDPMAIKLANDIVQKREKAPFIEIKEKIDAQRPKPTLPGRVNHHS